MKTQTFLTSLKPLYYISVLIGFFLFTLDFANSTASLSKWNLFQIIVILTINFFMSCSYWFVDYYQNVFATKITSHSMPILLGFDHMICLFGIFWILIRRRNVSAMLKLFIEVDEILQTLGIEIDYKKQSIKTIKVTICVFLIVVAMISIGFITQPDVYNIPLVLFSTWLFSIAMLQFLHFFFIATSIALRLELMSLEVFDKNLQKASKIHLKVVEIVKHFNRVYSPPMMLTLASVFAWNCVSAFSLAMISKEDSNVMLTIIPVTVTLAATTGEIMAVVHAAERVQSAKVMAIENLYRMINRYDGENCGELLSFITQITNMSVTLCCKFFDYNWKFFFKVSRWQF